MSSESDVTGNGGAQLQTTEARLAEIRREGERQGQAAEAITQPVPVAMEKSGYYGLPVLKPPPWKWEIPAYFFVGGAAGAAAVVGVAARIWRADPRLVRDAQRLAALGGFLSPPLLISDLGVPSRFLNMLRVFKLQSPMSVGSWTLMCFSGATASATLLNEMGFTSGAARVLASGSELISALTGLLLSSYTGVLLGATAIPVWSENATILPIHFAASGLGTAVSILEVAGHAENRSLNVLGVTSAVAESAIGARIEIQPKPALQPLKTGASGRMTRIGGLLSGPVPLVLRLLAGKSGTRRSRTMRYLAAGSAVAGSLLTRIVWLKAGTNSTQDPSLPLKLPERNSETTANVGRPGRRYYARVVSQQNLPTCEGP